MSIYLIIGLVFVLLCALSFILILIIKDDVREIKELKNENKVLSNNVVSLIKYSELIAKLRKDKEELNNELLQAETAEEIIDIIDRLLSNNNNRVRKQTEGK